MMDDVLIFPSSDGETGGALGVEASAHLATEEPERRHVERRNLYTTKKDGGSLRSEEDDKKSDNDALHHNRKRLRKSSTSSSWFPYLRDTPMRNGERSPVRRQHKRYMFLSLLVFSFVFLFTRHVIIKCGSFFSKTTGKHSDNLRSREGGIPRLLSSGDGAGEQQHQEEGDQDAHTPSPSPGYGDPFLFQVAQHSPQLLECLNSPPGDIPEEVDGGEEKEDDELAPEGFPLDLSVSGREREGSRQVQGGGMMRPDTGEAQWNEENAAGVGQRTEEEGDGDEERRRGIKRKKETPGRIPEEGEGNALHDDEPPACKLFSRMYTYICIEIHKRMHRYTRTCGGRKKREKEKKNKK